MEIACRGESGVCARRRKSGRQENVGTKFSNLTTRTKLGLTESRHATRYVCMHVHTHTHVRVHTGRAYSIPYLISLPCIYILPRWPSADVPFNAAKMPEEKFLVASRQRFSSNILARLFSSIPYGNIPSEYIGPADPLRLLLSSPFRRSTG